MLLVHGCAVFFTDIPRKLSQGGACPTVIAHRTAGLAPICPLPLWAGTHEKCGSIFHGNRRRAGVGLLAARTVFLQSHLYIHMKRSDVCKQGSEQTAGTPIITLPPPQPSPAALRCGGGSRTANDLTTVRPFFHRTAPPLQDAQRPQRGRVGVGVSDVACTWLCRIFHRHSGALS